MHAGVWPCVVYTAWWGPWDTTDIKCEIQVVPTRGNKGVHLQAQTSCPRESPDGGASFGFLLNFEPAPTLCSAVFVMRDCAGDSGGGGA